MRVGTLASKETYRILDDLTVDIEVLSNPYNFRLDELFQMATRINKKRSFLFVSKVLGKHLAVCPHIPLLVGSLLAMRYLEVVHGYKDPRIKEVVEAIQTKQNIQAVLKSIENEPVPLLKPTTLIGFAETATALGHAVFSTFGNNAKYIHTTREQINELTSIINFEEEHSHASSHRVYGLDEHFFQDDNEVVLVDDEMTTGKTAINIIKTIKTNYPSKKVFTVVSILDWRTVEHRERYRQLENELAITIHVVSLLDGVISVTGQPILKVESSEMMPAVIQKVTYLSVKEFLEPEMFEQVTSSNINGSTNQSPYLKATGRFGLTIEEDKEFSGQLQTAANHLREHRKGKRTLVIGTGEFMYVPMHMASNMGPDVYFQATTRSPIYQTDREDYTIQHKFVFDSPEDTGVINHLYNIEPHQYDEIFIFIERISSLNGPDTLIKELTKTQIPFINMVIMTDTVE